MCLYIYEVNDDLTPGTVGEVIIFDRKSVPAETESRRNASGNNDQQRTRKVDVVMFVYVLISRIHFIGISSLMLPYCYYQFPIFVL